MSFLPGTIPQTVPVHRQPDPPHHYNRCETSWLHIGNIENIRGVLLLIGTELSVPEGVGHTVHPSGTIPSRRNIGPDRKWHNIPLWTEWQTRVKHYLPATSFEGDNDVQLVLLRFIYNFYSYNRVSQASIAQLVACSSACLVSHCEQQHDQFWAPPMPAHRYMKEIGLATMLAAKRSAGVTHVYHVHLHQAWIRLANLALKPRVDIKRNPN